MTDIIEVAVRYGLPTVLLCAVSVYHATEKRSWDKERAEKQLAWDKERLELARVATEEARLRITDAKDAFGALRDMQAKVTDAVAKLSDVAEMRELQRELIDSVTKVHVILDAIEKGRNGPQSRGMR